MAKNIISIAYEGQLTTAPNTGAGHPAAIGSILPRVGTTELWVKFGAADTQWQLLSSGGSSVLTWGAGAIGNAADTRFLPPGRIAGTAPTTDDFPMPVPRAGLLRNFYVYQDNPLGDGDNIVYTVLVNGVATAISVTIASNATGPVADTTNQVAVVAGDRIAVRAVKATDITNGGLNVQCSLEFV